MNKRYSNLLTSRFRLFMLIRRRLTQWSIVWVVATAVSLCWWQLRALRVNAADERVTLMDSRYSPLQQLQIDNQHIRQQLTEMNSHESLLTRLDDEQVPYRLLAIVSMQVGARDGSVRVESFNLTRTDTAGPAGPGHHNQTLEQKADIRTHLAIQGIAADNLAVSRFVAGLRDTHVFETVDLKSSVGARVDNHRAQSFMIDCAF